MQHRQQPAILHPMQSGDGSHGRHMDGQGQERRRVESGTGIYSSPSSSARLSRHGRRNEIGGFRCRRHAMNRPGVAVRL
jgi:hypothetical protein